MMAENSKIEWTDATWNPLRARDKSTGKVGWHCEKISPACAHCYAASTNRRFGTGHDYKPDVAVETFLDELALLKPLAWKRPRKIFPCSMTDLFLDDYPEHAIDALFAVMYAAQWHTFQVLTKRPERMHAHLSNPGRAHAIGCLAYHFAIQRNPHQAEVLTNTDVVTDVEALWPLPNVWLGVTAEDQQRADERIPWLLRTPAVAKFISCEPLLGPIQLWKAAPCGYYCDESHGHIDHPFCGENHNFDGSRWQIIIGGESGPGARPMHPDWARSLRDQCQAASVPFFFKQWGEFVPYVEGVGANIYIGPREEQTRRVIDGVEVFRVGKKSAGRLLDGREWNEYPQTEVHA
jgi:protein gp37